MIRRLWTDEERCAIKSPNRHVVLPTPARAAVESALRELAGELPLFRVTGIGLFGSVACGDDAPDSDVDVAVQMPSGGIMDYANVGNLLEVHFNRHVDVVRLPFPFPLDVMAGGELLMAW